MLRIKKDRQNNKEGTQFWRRLCHGKTQQYLFSGGMKADVKHDSDKNLYGTILTVTLLDETSYTRSSRPIGPCYDNVRTQPKQ